MRRQTGNVVQDSVAVAGSKEDTAVDTGEFEKLVADAVKDTAGDIEDICVMEKTVVVADCIADVVLYNIQMKGS